MLRPLKDAFFVRVHKAKHDTLTVAGKELFLDTDFNKYKHAVQYGTVASVPHVISHHHENEHGHQIGYYGGAEIKEGEKIYFHHFVTEPQNRYDMGGETVYLCRYDQVYCVIRDEKIEMIEDWLLAEPIMEDESNFISPSGIYLKPSLGVVPNIATVRHVSKVCAEQGITPGDTIVYKKDANYDMKVEGTEYYRMKAYNVAVIIRNGELTPVRDTLVIKEHKQENEVVAGIEVVSLKKRKQQYATVLSMGPKVEPVNLNLKELCFAEYKESDTIVYHNGTAGYVEHEKEIYGVIEAGNVLGFISSRTSI